MGKEGSGRAAEQGGSAFSWWLSLSLSTAAEHFSVCMLLCTGAAGRASSPACLCSQLEAGLDCRESQSVSCPLITFPLTPLDDSLLALRTLFDHEYYVFL